jgi:penicillin-insensitive murein endopeptidase
VDLGFYAIDAQGKPVHAKSFIQFDARLASATVPGARFDVPRNWLLVQLLLTDPRAHVSHIFIADTLRYALLTHAKRLGVSHALLVRAELAMMQPTGAEPHDDHMHVRISCPRAMVGSCIELAKNAPMGRHRARTAKVLRTPRRGALAKKLSVPAAKRRGDAKATATESVISPPPASRGVAQQPMSTFELGFLMTELDSQPDVNAESDDADAKDALDDSGTLKITD